MFHPLHEVASSSLMEFDDISTTSTSSSDVQMRSFASSDISLGSDDDTAMQAFADDITLGSDDDDDDSGDCFFEDEAPLMYPDSLNISILPTGSSFLIETRGSVALQMTGHLCIMSQLSTSLPVTILSSILRLMGPSCLQELTLSQLSLCGTIQEYEDFGKAVCFLENLEELRFVDCCLLNEQGARPLDTILYGISCDDKALPKLRRLQLYAVDIDREPDNPFLDSAALAHFIRNKPTLEHLDCEDLTLQTRHIVDLAKALETHQRIETLNLWGCAIANEGAKAIARLLKNNSSIQQLELSCNEIGNKGCVAIARALQSNKTLKELRLVRNEKINHGGKGYEALLEMIKWNHKIEELLLQPSGEVDSDLGFYLFVNRHRYLLEDENITKGQLVDLLFEHREDPTFLFLFLKAKPALCGG